MNAKLTITIPLYQLCGFIFSLFGVGFLIGMQIMSQTQLTLPLIVMLVSLGLTSAGLLMASKRDSR
jgi:hypothetical protein